MAAYGHAEAASNKLAEVAKQATRLLP